MIKMDFGFAIIFELRKLNKTVQQNIYLPCGFEPVNYTFENAQQLPQPISAFDTDIHLSL